MSPDPKALRARCVAASASPHDGHPDWRAFEAIQPETWLALLDRLDQAERRAEFLESEVLRLQEAIAWEDDDG